MSRPPAAPLALVALLAASLAAAHQRLCSLDYCQCAQAAHPSWTLVNCTVPRGQVERLDILAGDLPENTVDLTVRGAQAVMFGADSLSGLKDLHHIRVFESNIILFRTGTAVKLQLNSAYLRIDKCDVLRIEEKAFSEITGPLSVSISNCDSVSVEGPAFSWLLSFALHNARQANLGAGVFALDSTARNVDEHGPGMTIELRNLTIPELAEKSFGASAAAIRLEEVQVLTISASAFPANTYNVVVAVNSSFNVIEGHAFSQKSLINNLQFEGCRIRLLSANALLSAVNSLNISNTRFDYIETGAVKATVANVVIVDSVFKDFMERGIELYSWNKLQMERNSFDELPPQAIVAPAAASIHELSFVENEIETAHSQSLGFIGQAEVDFGKYINYNSNYFGQTCHCNVTTWLSEVLNISSVESFENESYCTVDEFFARCFNVPEQNMMVKKFVDSVCVENQLTIKCEATNIINSTEIKNPRFPHKKEAHGTSHRNIKVIGIVIVSVFGCVVIAMFVSLIKWIRRKGYCVNLKNILLSSNSCGSFCERLCFCRSSSGLDNARSISQLSVNEYSERHRLNEPRVHETVQETVLPEVYTEQMVPLEDKTTQTLPEELTKELLENLKEKLEDPENYVEAREMIEHLYELIKVEENCNSNVPIARNVDENIYELPFQNTTPRIGKNKKQMISIGTRTPSLEKLTPLSPYNRQTALAHEYFEPKDFAVHLYAEIANSEKEKKSLLSSMPDVVSSQVMPRGPYLRAKMASSANSSPSAKSTSSSPITGSTIKSNKSNASNTSGRMVNRPLPEKPAGKDPGEGTSLRVV